MPTDYKFSSGTTRLWWNSSRHCGQSTNSLLVAVNLMCFEMQLQQNRCPQGIQTGGLLYCQQSEHRNESYGSYKKNCYIDNMLAIASEIT